MIHFLLLVSLPHPRLVAKEITPRSENWIFSRPEADTVRGKDTYWAGSDSQCVCRDRSAGVPAVSPRPAVRISVAGGDFLCLQNTAQPASY